MVLSKHLETSDHALVASLYQQYAPAILTYLIRQLPTREDAEDVLLEVFQVVLESNNRLLDLDAERQKIWLWGVARHKCSDQRSRARKHPTLPLNIYEDKLYADDFSMPELLTLRAETHNALREHLSLLSEQQQHLLLLRFAYGLRCPEIAARLNKGQGAVRAMLSRTLNLLRHHYSTSGEDETHV